MVLLYTIICVIIIGLAWCFGETLRFRVTEYDITTSSVADEDDNTVIVLLTDLHCKSFGKDNRKLFDSVASLNPDMIIIGGDLINGLPASDFDKGIRYAVRFLEGLDSLGCPVFYEFGNHELKLKRISDEAFRTYLDEVSPLCNVLNNETVDIGKSLRLSGLLLDRRFYKGSVSSKKCRPKVRSYLGGCDHDKFNILIAHDPSFCDRYYRWGADLVLSGHYHGGIIRLPFLGGIISPRYTFFPKIDKGRYCQGNKAMIVSGGLGWHGIPFRFNNLPEIVCITLHTKTK